MLLMPVVLTACVTTGAAPMVVPVARGQASVSFSRPNAWYGAAVPVDIDANGARLASLAAGGSYTGPLPPGPVILTATSWSRANAETSGAFKITAIVN